MKVIFHYAAGQELARRLAALRSRGLDISVIAPADDAAFAAALPDCDVLWHVLKPATAAVMAAAPRLRLIQKMGAGVDTIDLAAARQRAADAWPLSVETLGQWISAWLAGDIAGATVDHLANMPASIAIATPDGAARAVRGGYALLLAGPAERIEDRARFHEWSDAMIGAQGNMSDMNVLARAGRALAFVSPGSVILTSSSSAACSPAAFSSARCLRRSRTRKLQAPEGPSTRNQNATPKMRLLAWT